MKLNDFFNASGGRVVGGSEYGWNCFPNAQMMDVANAAGEDVGSCVYNRTTFDVYEVTVSNDKARAVYKWTNPNFLQGYIDEANTRGVDPNNAYDDVQYTHIAEPDLVLGVVHDICNIVTDPVKALVTSPPAGWPFPTDETDEHVHGGCSHDHRIEEADDGEDDGESTDGCCGSCNGGCHSQPEPTFVVPPVPTVNTEFKVKIELCHEFDVNASSMEEAIAKAKYFVKQMKPSISWPDGVSWMDSYYTKESVTRELVNTSYDE